MSAFPLLLGSERTSVGRASCPTTSNWGRIWWSAMAEDMTIQDWGGTYDDLEPHYDKFEYLCGTSGKAGNIKGRIQAGGNPFEGARSRDSAEPRCVPAPMCADRPRPDGRDVLASGLDRRAQTCRPRSRRQSSRSLSGARGKTLSVWGAGRSFT